MRTVWSFGIPAGTQGKDTVASMGKLLSSLLKLNIQEALFSISSAWEPVKGEADGRAGAGGLSGGPGGSRFPRGVRDREALLEASRRRPASARSFSRAREAGLPRAGSLWELSEAASPLQVPGQMVGRRRERGLGP